MAMMKEMDFKDIANVKISSRIKQVVVLILIILVGILISNATQAQQPKHKVYRDRAVCNILHKKRNNTDNKKVVIAAQKKKYKPMAEMEAPASARANTRNERENKGLNRWYSGRVNYQPWIRKLKSLQSDLKAIQMYDFDGSIPRLNSGIFDFYTVTQIHSAWQLYEK